MNYTEMLSRFFTQVGAVKLGSGNSSKLFFFISFRWSKDH